MFYVDRYWANGYYAGNAPGGRFRYMYKSEQRARAAAHTWEAQTAGHAKVTEYPAKKEAG